MSSLRLLGTVGEAINPEAWMWYYKVIGGDRSSWRNSLYGRFAKNAVG
jgi:acyl-coenzyme A synthetase/AMP-(fatty) acid ligase